MSVVLGPHSFASSACVLRVPVLRWGDKESGGQSSKHLMGLWACLHTYDVARAEGQGHSMISKVMLEVSLRGHM